MSGLGINNLESIKLPIQTYTDTNGEEHEIDLKVRSSDTTEYTFENRSNTIQTFFKSNLCGYSPVKVETGDAFFEWTPLGAGFQDELGNEQWLGRVENCEAQVVKENTVLYQNMIADIDEEFQVLGGKLKHNTVLNSLPVYNQSLPGSDIEFVVEGKIDFSEDVIMYVQEVRQENEFTTHEAIVFKDAKGLEIFTLPAPITYEINGAEQIVCTYSISKQEENFISLKIRLPYSWLSEPSRQYPVAIDPTLTVVNNPAGVPSRVYSVKFSDSGKYLAVTAITGYRPFVYEIDRSNNTLKELPTPNGGYLGRGEYTSLFSPDDNLFIYSGYDNFRFYKYDSLKGGYTTELIQPAISRIVENTRDLAFSNSKNLFVIATYFSLRIYKYDSNTGLLSNEFIKTLPNKPLKVEFNKNDNLLYTVLEDGSFKIFKIEPSGTIGSEITVPALPGKVTDFNLSEDMKFITLATENSPGWCVFRNDPLSGIIGQPIYPAVPADSATKKIRFSKRMKYIVIAQYLSASLGPALIFYRFNSLTGEIGEKIKVTNNVGLPVTNENALPKGLEFSKDGMYLGYAQDGSATGSLFLFKFFFEPYDNIYFKDEATYDYYCDNNGNIKMLLDFGQIIAGQTTLSKKVLIENANEFSVNQLQVDIVNNSSDFTVEMSKSDNPFIPETNLLYSGTMSKMQTVPIYFRVVTKEKAASGGMFEVRAKCNKI
ncbi:WD40 repeat domain-containing protein [Paenibacillus sp. UNC499MF]|uniref:WD40 repeat domain-containing protein n=1 Tax=Paenibacillus sp. UNC499MF TaxID=1502751 RepID=UPI00089FA485|nr:WD40 repeat domain-containing protein [Paenibacillus sp. UNC499MF]SEF95067.1 6-phosphogluconolactonase, cycloisomerase 2 family [Paenibacillus sp. UNC499MF]